MSTIRDSTPSPELVFGIAGPIGVDIPAICASLTDALRSVRYEAHVIHLTEEMMTYRPRKRIARPSERDFYTEVNFKIKYANALCEEFNDSGTLARIAMRSIAERRRKLSGASKRLPPTSTAYIIRQFKRPAEVALLRRVYVACTRFRRHRVRCFHGTGGASWRGGSSRESSSLRRCA
jgi:hypothetical protein